MKKMNFTQFHKYMNNKKLFSKLFLIFISVFAISIDLLIANDIKQKDSEPSNVLVITINNVINPVISEYISTSIKKASELKAQALIIELDTPGGLDTSMRKIVKDILASDIPIIIYVSPSGARAASAGVFITMSAHIAAMAQGTNIGAAHPVSIGEKMDKIVLKKATNDAAAYIKSIAERRDRNSTWAEETVRKSVSITEREALQKKVIDIVAKDLHSLLYAIDGKEVQIRNAKKTLYTKNAKIIKNPIGLRHKVLNYISNPSVAYILMMLGFYGLFFELANPGVVLPGVVGVISLVLAFYSFETLPINYAGVLLIIIGIILFLLEIKIVSYGLLTIGGLASIIIGSLMLVDLPLPFLRISIWVILPSAFITALFFIFIFSLAYKAQKRKSITGVEGLIGEVGEAKTDITNKDGFILIKGERWSAYSDNKIKTDDKVVIEKVEGLKLKVRKCECL